MKNITVDATASSSVTLIPSACNGTGWQVEHDRGFEGSGYSWCGSATPPKARFTFTGAAIYFSSPNFDGESMQLVLDGEKPESVDLSSPLRPELRPNSSIVWSKSGLDHKPHTLEISPGGKSTRVYLDTFIYTALDSQEIADLTGATPLRPSQVVLAARQTAEPERIANRAPIAVFSVIAFIVFAIFLAISYNLWKASRERRAQFDWKTPVPPLHQSQNFEASTGGVVRQTVTDSIQLRGESSLGHTQSAYQSPQPSYGPRPLPGVPRQFTGESDDEISSMQFYQKESSLATDSRKARRLDSSRGQMGYPPQQSPVRTETSFSSTKLEPNRRTRA